MNELDLSVVLTTHLRPSLLSRALESLLCQSNTNFQIILCSDEGSGETKYVARKYLRENDSFIVAPHMRGPSSTRNEGIRNVRYKKLIFMDDDDSFSPNFFEDITGVIRKSPQQFHYCNFTKIEENRGGNKIIIENITRVTQANNSANIFVGNFMPINSFIVDSLIAKSILFDCSLGSHEDWDYLINLNKIVNFSYVDIYGPNVHMDKNESRNNNSYADGSVSLDFLSIYRKHRIDDLALKRARQAQMQALGIAIPPELL